MCRNSSAESRRFEEALAACSAAARGPRTGRARALLLLGAVLIGGCDRDPVAPVVPTGTLLITVLTTGRELDSDGYQLVGIGSPRNVAANDTVTGQVPATTYVIFLQGIADNCAVEGSNTQTVVVTHHASVHVSFTVTCVATTTVQVTTVTTGVDADADGYRLSTPWWRSDAGAIATTGTATIRGFTAGPVLVELRQVAANCDVGGGHAKAFRAMGSDTIAIAFDVVCAAVTKLAFSRGVQPDIYVINSNGTGATRLTHTGVNREPSWSPDGGSIAFTSAGDVHVMGADGSNPRPLTTAEAMDYQPVWSPDGKRVVFVSERDGSPDLYIMNADGTDQVRLTSDPGIDDEPAWSPDGSRIAFTSTRDGSRSIYVMNPDGSGVARLTSPATTGRSPAWSPDGTRLAFTSEYCSGSSCTPSITVMNADGSAVRGVGLGVHATWSRDSRRIAYIAVECNYNYYRVCVDPHIPTTGIRIVLADDYEYGPSVIDLTTDEHDARPAWRR